MTTTVTSIGEKTLVIRTVGGINFRLVHDSTSKHSGTQWWKVADVSGRMSITARAMKGTNFRYGPDRYSFVNPYTWADGYGQLIQRALNQHLEELRGTATS